VVSGAVVEVVFGAVVEVVFGAVVEVVVEVAGGAGRGASWEVTCPR
jgi:hypothetical protein